MSLHTTKRFRKDFRREIKTDAKVVDLLRNVVDLLVAGKELPEFLKDHPLRGNWKNCRECQLMPDLLLIYRIADNDITLVRLGSHNELFQTELHEGFRWGA